MMHALSKGTQVQDPYRPENHQNGEIIQVTKTHVTVQYADARCTYEKNAARAFLNSVK